jgi:hypothetical protein
LAAIEAIAKEDGVSVEEVITQAFAGYIAREKDN